MDEQRVQDRVSETTEKVGTMASDAAKQAGASMQGTLEQGKAMIQDAQTSAATLARQASETGRQAMAQAGELVQGGAREASNQATQAASSTTINNQSRPSFIVDLSFRRTARSLKPCS